MEETVLQPGETVTKTNVVTPKYAALLAGPPRKNARLAEHALLDEGRPFTAEGSRHGAEWRNGHAKCSCGALSEALPSQGQRQKWHREHKDQLRAAA